MSPIVGDKTKGGGGVCSLLEMFVFRIIWRALFSRKTRSEIRLLPCYGGTCLIFGVYGLIAS